MAMVLSGAFVHESVHRLFSKPANVVNVISDVTFGNNTIFIDEEIRVMVENHCFMTACRLALVIIRRI